MKKIIIEFCIVYIISGVLRVNCQPVLNPAVEMLNEDISFYVSFDNKNLNADLSNGENKPMKVVGKENFTKGKYGEALITGKEGTVVYYKKGKNINFQKVGALSFWVAPFQWIKKGTADARSIINFFRTFGEKGGMIIIERKGFSKKPKRGDSLISGFFSFPDMKKAVLTGSYGTIAWEEKQWHLIVFNWYPDSFELSVDGNPLNKKMLSRRISEEDFPFPSTKKGAHGSFIIGCNYGSELTLIDEFTVYTRPLTSQEITTIFSGKKD